jgi:hypothetical protein
MNMDAIFTDGGKVIVVRTTREAAIKYGINEKTLGYWRSEGRGPEYFCVGRYVFYTDVKFEEWLKAHKLRARKEKRNAKNSKYGHMQLDIPSIGADAGHEHGERQDAARCSSAGEVSPRGAYGKFRPIGWGDHIRHFVRRHFVGVKNGIE